MRRSLAIRAILFLLILAFFAIRELRHTYLNPDAETISLAPDGSNLVFKDRDSICFLVDEQSGKARGRIGVNVYGGKNPYFEQLYSSASCAVDQSRGRLNCSSLAVLRYRINNNSIDILPFPRQYGVVIYTGPLSLSERTYEVYLGEKWLTRLEVQTGMNEAASSCDDPWAFQTITLPLTPTPLGPASEQIDNSGSSAYPAPVITPPAYPAYP